MPGVGLFVGGRVVITQFVSYAVLKIRTCTS